MWYFVYKTTNLVNKRIYFGMHYSSDIFFGTQEYIDGYIGNTIEMNSDLKQYGRKAFLVQSFEAFTDRAHAERLLSSLIANAPPGSYHTNARSEAQKGLQNALGTVRSEEFKAAASERTIGEGNPFYGKQHSTETKSVLSDYRAQMIWINNNIIEKQIAKSDNIPDGFERGRLKRSSTIKVTVTKVKKPVENQVDTSQALNVEENQ
jgi:hypothetical protein